MEEKVVEEAAGGVEVESVGRRWWMADGVGCASDQTVSLFFSPLSLFLADFLSFTFTNCSNS